MFRPVASQHLHLQRVGRLSLLSLALLTLSLTVAVAQSGVFAWGRNTSGQLGDGTNIGTPTPVPVGSFYGAVAVAAGGNHTLCLKSDGTVWACGHNQYGQLGDGTQRQRTAPVLVQGLSGVIQVACGNIHSLALKSDGTVWAWGYGGNGRLGIGSSPEVLTTPTQVVGLTKIVHISALDSHSLALKSDGTVWAWGYNGYGQLGDGTTQDRSAPVQVHDLTNVIGIATGGQHSIALLSNGSVWAWGGNNYGQLGDGTSTTRLSPVPVSNLGYIAGIAAGYYHNLALVVDGSVWAWGYNQEGELGDGTSTTRFVPIPVTSLSDVKTVQCGWNHSAAQKRDNTVSIWGYNAQRQVDSSQQNRHLPVPLVGVSNFIAIVLGGYDTQVIMTDGTVQNWGHNGSGQLGRGYTSNADNIRSMVSMHNVVRLAGSPDRSIALSSDGTVWYWGSGYQAPQRIPGLTDIISIAAGFGHFLAAKADGTVWAWGLNDAGQLGDSTTTNHDTPTQVRGAGEGDFLTGVVEVAAGYSHSLARKSDGTLWAWGANNLGQLGDNTISQRLTPVQVKGPNGVGVFMGAASIASGHYHNLTIKTDGLLWAWGWNASGQLGLGNTNNRRTPLQVTALSNIVSIAAGYSHSLACKGDGSLWAWGLNNAGQLGDGTNTNRLSPTPILDIANIISVASGSYHSLALTSGGSVFGWGTNDYGQVGDGTYSARNHPVAVVGLTGITRIGAGFEHSLATLAPVPTISGTVTLEECAPDGRQITVTFRPTNNNPEFIRRALLAPDGSFLLTNIPLGAYTMRVKASKWLTQAATVDTTGGDIAGVMLELKAGDANNDDSVDILDLALLIQAFASFFGDFHWNPNADFNCDDSVNILDLDILIRNFDQQGDP